MEWHLKSRAAWIAEGDQNTKKNHNFATHRKHKNKIWELKDEEGRHVKIFDDATKLGVRHFGKLFSKPERYNLPHILSMIRKFPRFTDKKEDEEFFQGI